ncbi:tripartite tricarboxylate transporter substrate binding protein [Promicromonospora panici]|uniref:tripartite tricarboxylate transporter substrate binding protein n=1 Tax=Promicromonospora panici TaxID=2219658 RepID=UPI00101CFB43|nr:tripartite tricarboxylate transporter substrate binding protein [Promicromonospora panici]
MKSLPITALGLGLAATLALTACSSTGASAGGAFRPSNTTMTVPFSAGGGSDISGRTVAAGLEAATGVNVTTENREGGAGAVGYSYFLGQAGTDSHLLATETSLLTLPIAQDVEFDHTSFTPIAKFGDDYTLLVVRADSPYRTCADVVDAAGTDRVVAAVSGAVSLDEVVFSMVEKDQDVEFDRVPFESGGEVLAGLLAGQVDIASLNPSEAIGQIESGDFRALCAFAEERYEYEELADIPTAAEQGIDVAFAQFRGIIAPGGISDEAADYWIDVAGTFAESDEYTTYIEDNYLQPNVSYGDEFAEYLETASSDLETVFDK